MSKVNLGTLPSTQHTFSVLLDSVCAVRDLITNCNKSQIATVVSQFVTVEICDGSNTTYRIQMNKYVAGLILSNETQMTRILNFRLHFRKTDLDKFL